MKEIGIYNDFVIWNRDERNEDKSHKFDLHEIINVKILGKYIYFFNRIFQSIFSN